MLNFKIYLDGLEKIEDPVKKELIEKWFKDKCDKFIKFIELELEIAKMDM